MNKIKAIQERIDKEKFINYYNNHSNQQALDHFKIESLYLLEQLCIKYGVEYKKRNKITYNDMIQNVPKEMFVDYYFNHSAEQTMSHFQIGSTIFNKFLKYYQIKKPQNMINDLRKKTNIEKYGVSYPQSLKEFKNRSKKTKLERYGNENYVNVEKMLKTRIDRYGSISYHNIEKMIETNLSKYGVEYSFQNKETVDKAKTTKLLRYNDSGYHNIDKMKQTNLQRYGVEYNFSSEDDSLNGRAKQRENYIKTGEWNNRKKIYETCIQKFGQDYFYHQAHLMLNSVSSHSCSNVNRRFRAYLLSNYGIVPESIEYRIGNFIYDFKLGNYLLELDPYATHNSTWGIYNNPKPIDYHRLKTLNALSENLKCIHIFDWINIDLIIYHILNKDLDIIDTKKPVKHIFDFVKMELTNKESENTVLIYDDGFNLIC